MLDLFDGQLSLDDIKNSTYKELGYLKNAREEIRKRKAHSGEGVANAFSNIRRYKYDKISY